MHRVPEDRDIEPESMAGIGAASYLTLADSPMTDGIAVDEAVSMMLAINGPAYSAWRAN